jgi:transposase
MSKKKPSYTEEFKREAVELLLTSDKTIDEIAKDLGVSRPSLSNWKRDYGGKARKTKGLSKEE